MSDTPRLSMRETRTTLGKLVDHAHYQNRPTVIEKSGEPRAVLVSYAWYTEHTTNQATTAATNA